MDDYRQNKSFNQEQLEDIINALVSGTTIKSLCEDELKISRVTLTRYVKNSGTTMENLKEEAKSRQGVLTVTNKNKQVFELRRAIKKFPSFNKQELADMMGVPVKRVEELISDYKLSYVSRKRSK